LVCCGLYKSFSKGIKGFLKIKKQIKVDNMYLTMKFVNFRYYLFLITQIAVMVPAANHVGGIWVY
jgi:hypothetical protein